MKRMIIFIELIALALLMGCSQHASTAQTPSRPNSDTQLTTWDPPDNLDFLRTVPELRGVHLAMSETEFQELIKSRNLAVQKDMTGDTNSYWVTTDTGENVMVMFEAGQCIGIQRLRPTNSQQ